MARTSANAPDTSSWRPRTAMIHGGVWRSTWGETSEALFLTSGYVYDSAEEAELRFKGENNTPGFIYSRFGNPTVRMFEERMMALEGAEDARATATGMAAVTSSLLCQLRAGDHVVAGRAMFGSCRYVIETLLPRFGITSTLVDGADPDAWRTALRSRTRAVFIETPANPTLDIVDIRAVSRLAHDAGACVVVDNVFATPILQRPLDLDADVVVYSTTKHMDGQGRCLGGIVLSGAAFISEHLGEFLRQTGPALSPFNAWVMLKSLETLDLRVHAHAENAAVLARFLCEQDKITRVLYPGLPGHGQHELARAQMSGGGSIVTFEVAGGQEAAFRLANALRLIRISNNLGDTKSLITHPATTTHQRLSPEVRAEMGITGAMLRLSVGLEDAADLMDDLRQALEAA